MDIINRADTKMSWTPLTLCKGLTPDLQMRRLETETQSQGVFRQWWSRADSKPHRNGTPRQGQIEGEKNKEGDLLQRLAPSKIWPLSPKATFDDIPNHLTVTIDFQAEYGWLFYRKALPSVGCQALTAIPSPPPCCHTSSPMHLIW